jgi:hypothetical protein
LVLVFYLNFRLATGRTAKQEGDLERLQARCLKVKYGFHRSYDSLLQESGLVTLKERRIQATDRFALKCSKSDRFKDWFRPNEASTSERIGVKYHLVRKNLERTKSNPIDYYTRRLNEMHSKERKAAT